MKKRGLLILVTIICFILSSCSLDDIQSENAESWTILMYICGTDLESIDGFASSNLEEIMDSNISKDINIIIQTGGTSEWNNESIDPEKSQRFSVEDGELVLIDEFELQNMGDSSTLCEFIDYGIDNYEADNYGLVFWNHGAGSIDGVAFDEMYNNDSLQVIEIEDALNSSTNLNEKFEFVGFDCCLMSNIETAKVLEPYSKYMIASEEYEPGNGWDYEVWLEYLSSHSYKSGKGIGRKICESYFDKCYFNFCEDMATLAVVDLSKIPDVIDALEEVSYDFCIDVENEYDFSVIAKSVSKTEQYGGSSDEEGYTNFIDLSHLMSNVSEEYGDKAKKVIEAIDEAVVFSVNGQLRKNANGLSIFYPLVLDNYELEQYEYIAATESYNDFVLRARSEFGENENYHYYDYILEEPFINNEGYYQLDFNVDYFDFIDSVNFSLYYYSENVSDKLLYLGSDSDVLIDYEIGVVQDNFSGAWPALNGHLINMDIIEECDKYILYTVPIILNGKETNLRVSWVWEDDEGNGRYDILGTWDGLDTDSGMSSRKVDKLNEGDEISLVYYYYDSDTEEYFEEIGECFILEDEAIIDYIDLDEGIYYYNYYFDDIFGQEFETEYTEFYIDENGELFADY